MNLNDAIQLYEIKGQSVPMPAKTSSSMPSTGSVAMPSPIKARDFSQSRRKKLAKSGAAMPGGRYPIVNREDLKNAEQAIGRTSPSGRAAVRKHIHERAKALGVSVDSSDDATVDAKGVHESFHKAHFHTHDVHYKPPHHQGFASPGLAFGKKKKAKIKSQLLDTGMTGPKNALSIDFGKKKKPKMRSQMSVAPVGETDMGPSKALSPA